MQTIDRRVLFLTAAFLLLTGCDVAPPTELHEERVAAFTLETGPDDGAHGPVVASARGGGHYFVGDGDRERTLRHTSVVALKFEDGAVRGQLEVRDPTKTDRTRIHAAVTCLTVEGRRAWVGGEVTHVDSGAGEVGLASHGGVELEVGSEIGLVLVDGDSSVDGDLPGDGESQPDRLSEVIVHAPDYSTDDLARRVCTERPVPALHEVEAGNLTVATSEGSDAGE